MIESGLFFAAGFVSAILLVMIVAPAIWRRAVHLTRKRIENAVPMTVKELQADKDRLRAEHAIARRKLDMALKKQLEVTSQQAAEISGHALAMREKDEIIGARDAEIAELTARIDALEEELATTSDALSETRLELSTVQATLSARQAEQEGLERLTSETEGQLKKARADLDRQTRTIAKLEAQIGTLREKAREQQEQARASAAEAKQTAQLLKSERQRVEQLEAELERARKRHDELQERVKSRRRQMRAAQDDRIGSEAAMAELEHRVEDAERERAEVERELGEVTVRLNRMIKALGGRDPEAVIEGMNARIAQLMTDVKQERARAEAAEARLHGATSAADEAGQAALREEIGQLAAQVVHMAAMLEGEGSPIPDMVAGNGEEGDAGRVSLAARIRALQDKADGTGKPG
ncbi:MULTISPECIES: hypothetical protein [unclassified Roseitalea]|uniref:hypothetical protein n=1 Tax=unclassified Roseitalea TaxID=2639107 RepID=UPI00273EFF70|nr:MULTISPECIES: hypothetical protein [unclassified Roseitalea]